MFKRTVIFTLACCASAALMVGCGGDSDVAATQCPETCPDNQICDESTGYKCVENVVEKKCPDSCPENQHCDASTGYKCVENADEKKCPESCPENQHCDASTDYKCVENQAVEKCPESCPAYQHCDESTGFKCAPEDPVCPDCAPGTHCDETTNYTCEPDPVECAETCLEDEHCDTMTGQCVPNQDKPVCDEECGEDYYCNTETGKCEKIRECEVSNEKSCSGDLLMNCSEEGDNELVEDCTEKGQICLVGQDGVAACRPNVCQPGTSRCDGSAIQVCNDYHEYVAGDDCASNADTPVCEEANNAAGCVAKCELGDIKCDGMDVLECMESGKYEIKATCDGTTNTCLVDPGTNKASCVNFECTSEYRKCDGSVLKKCDGGWIVDDTDCSTIGSVCLETGTNQASCVEQKCTNGDKKCDGFNLMECKSYSWVLLESCLNKNALCMVDKNGPACVIPQELEDDTDTDGDYIPDYLECANDPDEKKNCEDTDNDGTPDYLDLDSDGDGIPDKLEANNGNGMYEPDDADYDEIPNYRDPDSDGNGINDSVECCGGDSACMNDKENGMFKSCLDKDGDGIPNFLDFDNDNDGATDVDEIKGMVINPPTPEAGKFSGYGCKNNKNTLGSASSPVDCDGNASPDYMDYDSDGDGLCDSIEGTLRTTVVINGVKRGSYARYNPDTDGDGIPDALEAVGVSDVSQLPAKDSKTGCYNIKTLKDSDGDGIPDMLEVDSDDDGLSDYFETYCCKTSNQTTQYCKNNNNWCSDSSKADTDGDGVTDLVEYGAETNPRDAKDNPQSKGNFVFVVPYKGESTPKKQSLSFETSIQAIDLFFIFDYTGSMGSEIQSLATGLPNILNTLQCKDLGRACLENGDCVGLANSICSEGGRCITSPSYGQGCFDKMQTGISFYSDIDTFWVGAPISDDPQKTIDALNARFSSYTTSAHTYSGFCAPGWAEPPYQQPFCALLGNNTHTDGIQYCKNSKTSTCKMAPTSSTGCGTYSSCKIGCSTTPGRIGCAGFRDDAIRVIIEAFDEEECTSNSGASTRCAQYKSNFGTVMQHFKARYIGLWGDAMQTYAKDMSNKANGSDKYAYKAVDSAVAEKTLTGIREIAKGMPLDVTSSVEDVDKNASKLIDHLEINIAGGETVQNRVCAKITNTLTNTNTKYPGISKLLPGTVVCYDVIPVASQSIFPATAEPQVFKARVKVSGDGSVLNSGIAYFLVPPVIGDGGEISN